MTDLFGKDPAVESANAAGNAMLAQMHAASKPQSVRSAQSGQPTQLGERLSAALSELEAAKRSGDAREIESAETHLDALVKLSREQRGAGESERTRNADGTYAEEAETFDGGVRRGTRQRRPVPGMREDSPGQAFRNLIDSSRRHEQERGETEFGQIFG